MRLKKLKSGQCVLNLSTLEKANFEGPDMSLAISLFEYGMAGREVKKGEYKGEYEFIYAIGIRVSSDDCIFTTFDRCTVSLERIIDDYQDDTEFKSFIGLTESEKLPLEPYIISDLVSYYGFDNIFGSSYWNGFEITTNQY